jgi:glycosyltransferase involved in cell wall biosynthesis
VIRRVTLYEFILNYANAGESLIEPLTERGVGGITSRCNAKVIREIEGARAQRFDALANQIMIRSAYYRKLDRRSRHSLSFRDTFSWRSQTLNIFWRSSEAKTRVPMISVSVVIPCLQEALFIERCVRSVLAFDTPSNVMMSEVLILDGGSTDGTRDIVKRLAEEDSRIKLLDNPKRIQSTALNIALQITGGEYIMRLDAHSFYPSNYLALTVETSLRTGCQNVGGLFIAQPRGPTYQASLVQALTTHRFGVGDAGYRTGAGEGPADTVPYGFFRRELFERLGLFDERLVRAQDYEFNRRIIAAGGCVWRNPAIQVMYFQQPDLWSFIRKQVVREAPFNAYLWYLAPYAFAVRHAITGVFALGVIAGVALSPFSVAIRLGFATIFGIYLATGLVAAVQQAIRYRMLRHMLFLPPAFFVYHFTHGLGLLFGLLRLVTRTAPVQQTGEPWPGAGRFRAWPPPSVHDTVPASLVSGG